MDIEDIKTIKYEGDFKPIRNLKDFGNLKDTQDVKYIMNIRTSEILRIILLTLSSAMAEEAMKTWGGVKCPPWKSISEHCETYCCEK